MSDFQKKHITVTEIKEASDGTRVSIKDQDNISYCFFKEWKGASTQPYGQFTSGNHNESFNVGDNALISYVEKPTPRVVSSLI